MVFLSKSNPTLFSKAFNGILNFFYPPFCSICHSPLSNPQQLVCMDCWSSMPFYGEFHLKFPAVKKFLRTVEVAILGADENLEPLSRIIHDFKYERRVAHSQGIASRMGLILLNYPWLRQIDIIVPVPLHSSRLKSRGYNQSQLLADHLGNTFGLPVVSEVLIRIRPTLSQTKLNQQQRLENVAGAFQAYHLDLLKDKQVLLVDDVITTGATLNECAKTLLKAGAQNVHAVAGIHFQHPLP
jgi:ComF family protein